ncbi:MAG: phosphotransferase family protein [Candidatus Dormibacteraceae bacterium]
MPKDVYIQPDAPDPVLSEEVVLALVRRHVPDAQAVTGIDESGGEARTYAIDSNLILKVQRPQQLRPRTSLAKEAFFLRQLESSPDISVPRVLGYGRDSVLLEYTVMTRMQGCAMRHVPLSKQERAAVLFQLGQTLRRIHSLPQMSFTENALFPGDRTFAAVQQRFREYFVELAEVFQTEKLPWPLRVSLREIGERVLASLPESDERVALHSNTYAEHTFVDPLTHTYLGLIDFGDAYISHPTFDLRRWNRPAEREALLEGYTASAPVSAAFMATWKAVMILADVIAMAHAPDRATQAADDLQRLLATL